ncbi:MAG: zinc-binding dehydrogenase [Fidelibacterota bacterium]|nr:MAG: zinc-binding dehydrogenase [Candidatus Neomarinimicrobiota bacterium]
MKSPTLVNQVQITRHGGPRVLRVVKGHQPQPQSGEVLIRNHFAGINFADIMTRLGLYQGAPKQPAVPGFEIAGEVEHIGPGVSDFRLGDQVLAITRFGGYSSHVVAPVEQVRMVPEGVSLEAAAALPVTYLTAYLMLFEQGNLRPGQTVLIHNAGGGVGTAAVQLADMVGARIFGTSSRAKHERLRRMGVDLCIDYREEDFVRLVREATAGRGVDLILDAQGPANFRRSLKALAPLGTLVMYGVQHNIGTTRLLSAPLKLLWELLAVRFSPLRLMNTNWGIYGFHLGRLWTHPEPVSRAMLQLVTWLGESKINRIVDRIFPYHQAAQAHAYIQDRRNFGKVLLDFREL